LLLAGVPGEVLTPPAGRWPGPQVAFALLAVWVVASFGRGFQRQQKLGVGGGGGSRSSGAEASNGHAVRKQGGGSEAAADDSSSGFGTS
jgi:hypothetical protein